MSIASKIARLEQRGFTPAWPEEEKRYRPIKGGVNWLNVDWTMADSDIARRHKCRPSTVHYARKRFNQEGVAR